MITVHLDGADNARDFGGTTNADGKRIAKGLFIRSNELSSLSAKDVSILKDGYGVSKIIDLRTAKEVAEKPDVAIPGCEWIHVPLLNESAIGITHEGGSDTRRSILSRLPEMRELYRQLVTDVCCVGQLRKVFDAISAETEGAILWHCSEGKDRCGIVSALFLAALDVGTPEIVEDYLLTNLASRKRARSYYWKVLAFSLSPSKAGRVRDLFLADEAYLESAFEAMRRKHGSIEAFIEDELAMTEEKKARLRSRCLMGL